MQSARRPASLQGSTVVLEYLSDSQIFWKVSNYNKYEVFTELQYYECKVKLALLTSGRGHSFVHINILVFNPGLILRIALNKYVSIFVTSHKCKFLHRKEVHYMGTAVAQWLRFCATNRKVAASIPAGVVGIFH